MDQEIKVQELKQGTQTASAMLKTLKEQSPNRLTQAQVTKVIRQCLCEKFGIQETVENDFYKLAVISIKSRDLAGSCLSDDALQKKIHQYDCHQTSLAAKKKILFLMFVERELGVSIDDDAAAGVKTIDDYASLLLDAWRGEVHPHGCG